MRRSCARPPVDLGGSAFCGCRFPPEVIVLAVRWYLRYGLSYRDLEELLAERGIQVDLITTRLVQRWYAACGESTQQALETPPL